MGPEDVRVWTGIPYAQPPVGDLRFEWPQPAKAFDGVYKANIQAKGCQQVCKLPPGNCPDNGVSEDCLYLSVFAPKEPSPEPEGYPVFFWIHGGAFTQGIGNSPLYNGTTFATKNVITVVINYRLGVLGYMATSEQSGNYGIMDQRMALKWTQDNIAAFGGDPTRVTVAGQSAGAMSVGIHMTSPGSQGLFSKAIMESNPLALPYHNRAQADENAKAVFKSVGCADGDISCIKQISVEKLLDAQENAVKLDHKNLFLNFLPFAPIVDADHGKDAVLPEQPLYSLAQGKLSKVPLLMGSVLDEGVLFVDELFTKPMKKVKYSTAIDALFGLHAAKKIKKMYPFDMVNVDSKDGREAFNVLATDLLFFCPLRNVTRGMLNENVGAPMTQYRFMHKLSFDCWGANYEFCYGKVCHGSELPFVFNVFNDGMTLHYQPTKDEQQLATDMSNAWTNFISGKPGVSSPQTPLKVPMAYVPLTSTSDNAMVYLNEPDYSDQSNPRAEYCDMWDSVGYFF
jgi:acetylcholinesterase/cholinesterase